MNAPQHPDVQPTSSLAPAAVLDGRGDVIVDVALPDLVVDGETDLDVLVEQVHAASVIAVDFPTLMDGRGYSRAQLLRQELGYAGELRATGDVGVDQLHYLLRSGFDTFALRPGTDVEAAQSALRRFSHHYVGVQVRAQAGFLR
jgi:uncharacterized protein (DUF934 family)